MMDDAKSLRPSAPFITDGSQDAAGMVALDE